MGAVFTHPPAVFTHPLAIFNYPYADFTHPRVSDVENFTLCIFLVFNQDFPSFSSPYAIFSFTKNISKGAFFLLSARALLMDG
jgi:hypothetical protein